MKFPDYYAVLGVDRKASQDEIRAAFRRLARKYHPDVSKEADAAERMAEVNEANAVLSDPAKRAAYDEIGHQAWAQGARSADDVRPPPGWSRGFEQAAEQQPGHGWGGAGHAAQDHSEFFEELFGKAARERARRHSRSQGGPQAWPGEDQHAEITLDLEEAYHGAEKLLQLGALEVMEDGHVAPNTRTLSVKIPAGVAEGQLIRLAGQGLPGFGGGAAGDLFLKVSIRPGPQRRVNGRDVTQKVFVAPWEAALGGDIEVRTPAGLLTVVVPAGSSTGRKLRVRGKGIPGGKQPGDLYLELDIAVPSAVAPGQREAWQALAQAYPGFNPRPQ